MRLLAGETEYRALGFPFRDDGWAVFTGWDAEGVAITAVTDDLGMVTLITAVLAIGDLAPIELPDDAPLHFMLGHLFGPDS
jgi:hypothetical protein